MSATHAQQPIMTDFFIYLRVFIHLLFLREDMLLPYGVNVEAVNPLLLVKDFDSNGAFTVDTQFMTNADTTVLATQGIIDHPVNPFTGNVITMEDKNDGVHFKWQPLEWDFYGDPYAGDKWYTVKDDILDPDNWIPMAQPY